MQLPTSVTASPYTPTANKTPSQAQANRTPNTVETPKAEQTRVQQPSQAAVPPQTDANTQSAFTAVEQANKTESSSINAPLKRTDDSSSKNPAINNYLQMAKEGTENAQVQDTGLFRVDVYV